MTHTRTRDVRKRDVRELGTRALIPTEGIALVMVILVLAALVLVGTPFVISMKQQESASVYNLAQRRAEIATHSVRNHAVASLMGTHPARDKKLISADLGTKGKASDTDSDEYEVPGHKVDTADELVVSLDRVGLLPLDQVDNDVEPEEFLESRAPDGQILDVRIEDEQGKSWVLALSRWEATKHLALEYRISPSTINLIEKVRNQSVPRYVSRI